MVNENKNLDNTTAGKEVEAGFMKERERLEKMVADALEAKEEALKAQDQELARAMAKQQKTYNARIRTQIVLTRPEDHHGKFTQRKICKVGT